MQEGLLDLRLWLRDLAREGWGAHADDPDHFDAMARRLVDAQAPGLSSRVLKLTEVSGPIEAARQVGALHLLACAFERFDELDPALAADVLSLLGVTTPKKRILEHTDPVADRWWVMGRHVEAEEDLSVRRTWLLAERCGRAGLILDFAPAGVSFSPGLEAGQVVEGPAYFYPSAVPLRCLLGPEAKAAEGSGDARLGPWLQPLPEAWAAYRKLRVRHPWLRRTLVGLASAGLYRDDQEGWHLTDGERSLPLVDEPERAWRLLAATGGQGGVWGELDGDVLRPLSAWSDERLQILEEG